LAGLGQSLAPVAKIAKRRPLKAAIGKLAQHRDDGLGVMLVGRRDIDRQRNAVFLNGHMDLDAANLFAAVDATRKAARRQRPTQVQRANSP
jgi:alanine dehydrogenase